MAIFRKSETRETPLVVSVTGVRLGQRVLVVAGRDRAIVHDVAARVGLTGRTLVLAAARDVEAVQSAAERAGVLVDVAPLLVPLPVAGESFDVALVDDTTSRPTGTDTPALLHELHSALRPGGRVVIRLAAGGGPLARLFSRTEEPPAAAATIAALNAAGFRASRVVAVHGGACYVEASRPGD
jgi:SAM-dependent methyltransferase